MMGTETTAAAVLRSRPPLAGQEQGPQTRDRGAARAEKPSQIPRRNPTQEPTEKAAFDPAPTRDGHAPRVEPASPHAASSKSSRSRVGDPLEVLLGGKQLLPGESVGEIARRVWGALCRYRGVVLLCVLLALGRAAWLVAHRPVFYQAKASLVLRCQITGRRTLDQSGNQSGAQARSGELYAMRSDALLAQVAEELGLLAPVDTRARSAPQSESAKTARAARLQTLRLLRAGLLVTAEGGSNLVRVRYTSTDPRFAAELVNRLTDDYIDVLYRKRLTASDKIVRWQLGQLGQLKDEVARDEQRMLELQRALGLPGFNTQYNHFEAVLKDMQGQADGATISRIAAETRYNALQHAPLDQVLTPGVLTLSRGASATSGSTPASQRSMLAETQTQVEETEQQIARQTVALGGQNPRVLGLRARLVVLKAQRDHLAQGVVQQAKAALDTTRLVEAETRQTLATEIKLVSDLAQTNIKFVAAQRAFLESRYLYTQEYLKLRGAGFTQGLKQSPVEILDRASIPLEGERQAAWRIVLAWLAYGLTAGVVAALAMENLRGGLRSLVAVEQVLDLPGLIALPVVARQGAGGGVSQGGLQLAAVQEPHGPFALALDRLAGTLVLRDADLAESAEAGIGFGPDRLLLFTSATPSEGKTTIACNLAVALAARGRRVLLIDADLRRPTVHHRLGLSGRMGLSSVLTGKLKLADALQPMPGVPGVDVLGSGPVPPSSSSLLETPGFTALLAQATDDYTHVLVDGPPVLAVAEAVLLARLVDAVLLVVRHGKVDQGIVRRARDVLAYAHAPLLGVVLNAVPAEQPARATATEPAVV